MNRLLEYYFTLFVENLVNPNPVWDGICQRFSVSEHADLVQEEKQKSTAKRIIEKLLELKMPLSQYKLLLEVLNATGNDTLAVLMSIDPVTIPDGPLGWSVVVNELWDVLCLQSADEISEALGYLRLDLSPALEDFFNNSQRRFLDEQDRMGCFLTEIAKRSVTLEPLRKTFTNLGEYDPKYYYLAQKCITMNAADLEWLKLHRDAFILYAENVDTIVEMLKEGHIFTQRDYDRYAYFSDRKRKSAYVLNTLERKSRPGIIDDFIDACEATGNRDLALMMSFQLSDLQIGLNEFKLLQLNWIDIVNTVKYEDMRPFASSDALHINIRLKLSYKTAEDQEKIREMLQLLPISKPSIYDKFFFYLSLKYKDLFEKSFPMSTREKQTLLETQDFIALNMINSDKICNALQDQGILTTSEAEFLDSIPEGAKRNLAMCNVLKSKSIGTTSKFRDILWKSANRDCAEVLAVSFDHFAISTVEWAKLKQNWKSLVSQVSARRLLLALANGGAISYNQIKWVRKSTKNRQQMRKILRILPSKSKGFQVLLTMLKENSEYQELLENCTPMNCTEVLKIESSLDFLVNNTNDLEEVLDRLVSLGVLIRPEATLLTCYDNPEEEFYMMMMGKGSGTIQTLCGVLSATGNSDAASALVIDLNSIAMHQRDWKDFLEIWPEFAAQDYENVRKNLLQCGILTPDEDDFIMDRISENEKRMRILLCNLPYREGCLETIVGALTL